MTTLNQPAMIIEYCLRPLGLDASTPAYKDAHARLEHVIRTYQREVSKSAASVAVDFSKMPTLTINEAAHGYE